MTGKLIVFEGCDKAGKSTLSRMLAERIFRLTGHFTRVIAFPNRNVSTWPLIAEQFASHKPNPERLMYLFALNRAETRDHINMLLEQGYYVLIDRYIYSGIVYALAAGADMLNEMCETALDLDAKMPEPDLLVYLDTTPELIRARLSSSLTLEIYETIDFQAQVINIYRNYITNLAENTNFFIVSLDSSLPSEELITSLYLFLADHQLLNQSPAYDTNILVTRGSTNASPIRAT